MYMQDNLKSIRQKVGLTQKEVEKMLGMRNLMMRDYEMGRMKLPVNVAVNLSRLYNVTLDELVGIKRADCPEALPLENFKTLFHGNGFGVMFLDPILRAYFEAFGQEVLEHSIFQLITKDKNKLEQDQLIVEVGKLLNSLATVDGKISSAEQSCIQFLVESFGQKMKLKAIKDTFKKAYVPERVPKCFEYLELKHFIIWIMYFFAKADGNIAYQEIDYIDLIAEKIKMNKSNYLNIKKNFVGGPV